MMKKTEVTIKYVRRHDHDDIDQEIEDVLRFHSLHMDGWQIIKETLPLDPEDNDDSSD